MSAILFELIGGWEWILILSILLVLSGIGRWSRPRNGLVEGASESLKRAENRIHHSLILCLAQGFGIGRVPFAPGTFGSIVGMLWFCDLLFLVKGNFWFFLGGCMVGLSLSVYVCGAAENILKQTDPASIVLDEIASMPLCFAAWVGIWYFRNESISPMGLLSARNWGLMLCTFALFRFFDILKPWPVGQSQKLPGGWGVTLDDVLAAFYVNLATLTSFGIHALFSSKS